MHAGAAKNGYHHGDLRRALSVAGYALAREGGTLAVTLRETTRRAGVTAAAAYRHFEGLEDLQVTVSHLALADLARAIADRQATITTTDPQSRAVARLECVGLAYIDFALDEPGAFDVALLGMMSIDNTEDGVPLDHSWRTPYQLLAHGVEGLVEVGLLSPCRAQAATVLCWSAIHGFATLAVDGPISQYPRDMLSSLAAELVSGVVDGVQAGPPQNEQQAG